MDGFIPCKLMADYAHIGLNYPAVIEGNLKVFMFTVVINSNNAIGNRCRQNIGRPHMSAEFAQSVLGVDS